MKIYGWHLIFAYYHDRFSRQMVIFDVEVLLCRKCLIEFVRSYVGVYDCDREICKFSCPFCRYFIELLKTDFKKVLLREGNLKFNSHGHFGYMNVTRHHGFRLVRRVYSFVFFLWFSEINCPHYISCYLKAKKANFGVFYSIKLLILTVDPSIWSFIEKLIPFGFLWSNLYLDKFMISRNFFYSGWKRVVCFGRKNLLFLPKKFMWS